MPTTEPAPAFAPRPLPSMAKTAGHSLKADRAIRLSVGPWVMLLLAFLLNLLAVWGISQTHSDIAPPSAGTSYRRDAFGSAPTEPPRPDPTVPHRTSVPPPCGPRLPPHQSRRFNTRPACFGVRWAGWAAAAKLTIRRGRPPGQPGPVTAPGSAAEPRPCSHWPTLRSWPTEPHSSEPHSPERDASAALGCSAHDTLTPDNRADQESDRGLLIDRHDTRRTAPEASGARAHPWAMAKGAQGVPAQGTSVDGTDGLVRLSTGISTPAWIEVTRYGVPTVLNRSW